MSWIRSLQIVQASAPELTTGTQTCQVTHTGKVELSGEKGEVSVMGRRISNHVPADLLERQCLLQCHPKKLKGAQQDYGYGFASVLGLSSDNWPVLTVLKKPGSLSPFQRWVLAPAARMWSVGLVSGQGRGAELVLCEMIDFTIMHLWSCHAHFWAHPFSWVARESGQSVKRQQSETVGNLVTEHLFTLGILPVPV